MMGERLKLARKRKGMSLRALSDHLKDVVSAQAIGKYERDEMTPSSKVLIGLSKALDVPIGFLMAPMDIRLNNVEFRQVISKVGAKDKAFVRAKVLEHVERYLMIEEIIGVKDPGKVLPVSSKQPSSPADVEKLACQIRDKWNLGQDPIPDMTELLEEKGFKIIMLDLPHDVSGLTCLVTGRGADTIPAIVVNQSHNIERRRMTLAHELGHRIIPDSWIDTENVANQFAGAFLAPAEHLQREIGKRRHHLGYRELIDLKRIYRMSASALLMRLRQINVIDQNVLRRAYMTFARNWRKIEPEPFVDASAEIPRRMERLCLRALSEDVISISKAAELLRKPVSGIAADLAGPGADERNHN